VSRPATASGSIEAPPRHVLLRRLRFVVLGWLVFAVIEWVLSRITSRSFDESWDIAVGLSSTVCWTALTLGIWAWVGVLDRRPRPRLVTLAGHMAAVLVVGLIDAVWRHTSYLLIYGSAEQALPGTMLYFFDLTVVAYIAAVVLKRVADAHDAVVRQERRQLTLRAELASAQLAFLETQLQPHFLFNSLGAVLELAHEAPVTAARMLRQLAALLRFAVHGRGQSVTLAQELDALEPYLEIQRLRFADWLTISRQATPDALRVKVPSMTLQPIVENAIRHGLAGRTERGHIAIAASLDAGILSLTVSDNGVGLGATRRVVDQSGLGLSNLANRLRTLYGEDATVALRTAAGGGAVTEVLLRADVVPPNADGLALDDDEAAEPSPAQIPELFRRNLAATVVTGWLLWGLFWVQLNLTWMSIFARRSLPWTWPVIQNYGMGVVAWLAITPLMLASVRRNSLLSGRRWRRAVLHVVLACIFALLHVALWQTLVQSSRPFWTPGYFETMLWTVMLYAVLLALSSYHEFADWLRERKTATARLRAEIAEAELTSSAMRFDPENVLARLDVLADIVLRDASMAERALTQLAHRLRTSLDTAHAAPRTLEAFTTRASA
jgi:anti-sigma regulatory factor (Ser/Thr protein kinase)/DMSO/TMAO reductase YedYZ heme-binding membrane subunit